MVSDVRTMPLPHIWIITLVILKHLRYHRLLTCTHFCRYRCETNVVDKGCTNNSHVPEAAILTLDKDPTLLDTCEVARIGQCDLSDYHPVRFSIWPREEKINTRGPVSHGLAPRVKNHYPPYLVSDRPVAISSLSVLLTAME
jgi:hypothetical protein